MVEAVVKQRMFDQAVKIYWASLEEIGMRVEDEDLKERIWDKSGDVQRGELDRRTWSAWAEGKENRLLGASKN